MSLTSYCVTTLCILVQISLHFSHGPVIIIIIVNPPGYKPPQNLPKILKYLLRPFVFEHKLIVVAAYRSTSLTSPPFYAPIRVQAPDA